MLLLLFSGYVCADTNVTDWARLFLSLCLSLDSRVSHFMTPKQPPSYSSHISHRNKKRHSKKKRATNAFPWNILFSLSGKNILNERSSLAFARAEYDYRVLVGCWWWPMEISRTHTFGLVPTPRLRVKNRSSSLCRLEILREKLGWEERGYFLPLPARAF